MGYQTKMQLIKRKNSKQFYVSIPAALAELRISLIATTVSLIASNTGALATPSTS